jgi:amino acid transporter
MPTALGRLHPRYRTPHVAIVVQAIVASVVFLVSLFLTIAGAGTTVTEAYDILVGLTIIANLIPYFYLFAALVRLTRDEERPGSAPARMSGRRLGLWLVAGCGIVTTAVAIVLTFVPPGGTGNVMNYEANLVLQTAAVLVAGLVVYRWSAQRGDVRM